MRGPFASEPDVNPPILRPDFIVLAIVSPKAQEGGATLLYLSELLLLAAQSYDL